MIKLSDNYAGMSVMQEQERRAAILGKGGLISFGGGGSFDEEDKSGLVYTATLVNSSAAAKRIVLFNGALNSLDEIASVAGISADAIAVDGDVITTVEGETTTVLVSASAKDLTYLQRFLERNPTRVVEMQVTGHTKSQLAQKISVTKISPFQKLASTSFIPNQYRRASDSDTLMAQIDINTLQLDDQTVFDIVLAPNSGIDVTLFFGAMRNDAMTLSEQAKIALG